MNALLIVCGLGFVSLLAEIVNARKILHAVVIVGLIAAMVAAIIEWDNASMHFNSMLIFDRFSIAFSTLILVIAVFWFAISSPYFIGDVHQTDRSALVVFTLAGGIMMISFHNMAMLFLGLEILSISLYILAGSNRDSFFSNEAAFKYFIMGSFATGFLLMGIALVYGATGSFDISKITIYIELHSQTLPGFFYVGLFLLLIGLTFKISAVPFHFWAPDVYAGSPTMITALMSTLVKVAAIAAFYKIFGQCFLLLAPSFIPAIQVIVVLTLVVANLTAVLQTNVKRMLAFSSIAHVGYILLGFIAGSVKFEGILFYYLLSYSTSSLVAFGILYRLESIQRSTSLDAFVGLYRKNPFAAVCMSISLLSLAGIPPLSGFFAKYSILATAISFNYLGLVILAVVTSVIGVYYYFKPLIAMFTASADVEKIQFSVLQNILMGILTLLTLAVGLFPEQVIGIMTR
jgi:NADH-quinone oxidoreductase subunit N